MDDTRELDTSVLSTPQIDLFEPVSLDESNILQRPDNPDNPYYYDGVDCDVSENSSNQVDSESVIKGVAIGNRDAFQRSYRFEVRDANGVRVMCTDDEKCVPDAAVLQSLVDAGYTAIMDDNPTKIFMSLSSTKPKGRKGKS